jgi:hypothetical protein
MDNALANAEPPCSSPSMSRNSFKKAVQSAGFFQESAAEKLQAAVRARIARERFLASRQATIKIQAASRGKHARKGLMELFGRRRSGSMGAMPLSKKGFAAFTSGVDLTRVMAEASATSSRELKAQKIATERLSRARKNQAVHVHSKQLFASSASRYTPLRAAPGQPATYAATKARDGVRKTLLRDARRLSPLEMFLRVDKVGHSVLRPLAARRSRGLSSSPTLRVLWARGTAAAP